MKPVLFLILASVLLSVLAQGALKAGMTSEAVQQGIAAGGRWNMAVSVASQPLVVLGLITYGIGAVLWLFVLARVDLSYAYPFVGLGFVLTALLGRFVFHEELGGARLLGTALIIAGVFVLARE